MRTIGIWCLMAGLFAAANVVAAGVMLVLGRALQDFFPSQDATVWIMYAAGAAGAVAAVLFLRGAMAAAPLRWKIEYRRAHGPS